MDQPGSQFDLLFERAAAGDGAALSELFNGQRSVLLAFVASHLDERLSARLDAADIVQEVFAEASRKAAGFFKNRPVVFTAWLEQIALDRIRHVHRDHIWSEKRSVLRETGRVQGTAEDYPGAPVVQLQARAKTPSSFVAGKELQEKLAGLLDELPEDERTILTLRFREQLSVEQVACQLGITRENVRTRQLRALRRLRSVLKREGIDPLSIRPRSEEHTSEL